MELSINGGLVSDNPDNQTIAQALEHLVDKDGGFAILAGSEMTYMQIGYGLGMGFRLEYQEDSPDHHYRCTDANLSQEEVGRAFQLFLISDDRWRTEFHWRHMDMAKHGSESPDLHVSKSRARTSRRARSRPRGSKKLEAAKAAQGFIGWTLGAATGGALIGYSIEENLGLEFAIPIGAGIGLAVGVILTALLAQRDRERIREAIALMFVVSFSTVFLYAFIGIRALICPLLAVVLAAAVYAWPRLRGKHPYSVYVEHHTLILPASHSLERTRCAWLDLSSDGRSHKPHAFRLPIATSASCESR